MPSVFDAGNTGCGGIFQQERAETILSPYKIVDKEGLRYLTFDLFEQTGLVRHAFTTRLGGVSSAPYETLNLAFHVGDRDEAVLENRRILCRALGAEPEDLVAGKQVHGTEVRGITACHRGKGARSLESAIPDTDGLVTAEPGILLSSYYADCVPVMLLDPVKKAVGLAHAGWKGTAGRIAAKAVQTMGECFGTDPGDCLAVVGPSIGPCCYEIDLPVLEQFKKRYDNWPGMLRRTAPDRWKLNLWLANRRVLEEAGLKENNILEAGLCTSCNSDLFFSYRGQSGLCGRMASLIMLI